MAAWVSCCAFQDRDLRRVPAMKVVRPERMNDRRLLRFVQEAQVTAQLDHSINRAFIHEFGIDQEDLPFFTMKMVKAFRSKKSSPK